MYVNKITSNQIELKIGYFHVNDTKFTIEPIFAKHIYLEFISIKIIGLGNAYGVNGKPKSQDIWQIEFEVNKWVQDKELFSILVYGGEDSLIEFTHYIKVCPYQKYLYLLSNDYREFIDRSTIDILQQY